MEITLCICGHPDRVHRPENLTSNSPCQHIDCDCSDFERKEEET